MARLKAQEAIQARDPDEGSGKGRGRWREKTDLRE